MGLPVGRGGSTTGGRFDAGQSGWHKVAVSIHLARNKGLVQGELTGFLVLESCCDALRVSLRKL